MVMVQDLELPQSFAPLISQVQNDISHRNNNLVSLSLLTTMIAIYISVLQLLSFSIGACMFCFFGGKIKNSITIGLQAIEMQIEEYSNLLEISNNSRRTVVRVEVCLHNVLYECTMCFHYFMKVWCDLPFVNM